MSMHLPWETITAIKIIVIAHVVGYLGSSILDERNDDVDMFSLMCMFNVRNHFCVCM